MNHEHKDLAKQIQTWEREHGNTFKLSELCEAFDFISAHAKNLGAKDFNLEDVNMYLFSRYIEMVRDGRLDPKADTLRSLLLPDESFIEMGLKIRDGVVGNLVTCELCGKKIEKKDATSRQSEGRGFYTYYRCAVENDSEINWEWEQGIAVDTRESLCRRLEALKRIDICCGGNVQEKYTQANLDAYVDQCFSDGVI